MGLHRTTNALSIGPATPNLCHTPAAPTTAKHARGLGTHGQGLPMPLAIAGADVELRTWHRHGCREIFCTFFYLSFLSIQSNFIGCYIEIDCVSSFFFILIPYVDCFYHVYFYFVSHSRFVTNGILVVMSQASCVVDLEVAVPQAIVLLQLASTGSWCTMSFRVISWCAMSFHVISWITMSFCGVLCHFYRFVVYHVSSTIDLCPRRRMLSSRRAVSVDGSRRGIAVHQSMRLMCLCLMCLMCSSFASVCVHTTSPNQICLICICCVFCRTFIVCL